MEVAESHCLRTQQMYESDRLMAINYAKDECSKNSRCGGIEYVQSDHVNTVGFVKKFKICLDSIYTSTNGHKYKGETNQLLKKIDTHGTYNDVGIVNKLKVYS